MSSSKGSSVDKKETHHTAECVAALSEFARRVGEWRECLGLAMGEGGAVAGELKKAVDAAMKSAAGDGEVGPDTACQIALAGGKDVNVWTARLFIQLTTTKPSGAFVRGPGEKIMAGAQSVVSGSLFLLSSDCSTVTLKSSFIAAADGILDGLQRLFLQFVSYHKGDPEPSDVICAEVFNKCDEFLTTPSNNLQAAIKVLDDNRALVADAARELRDQLSSAAAESAGKEKTETPADDEEENDDDDDEGFFDDDFGCGEMSEAERARAEAAVAVCDSCVAVLDKAKAAMASLEGRKARVWEKEWEELSRYSRTLSEAADVMASSAPFEGDEGYGEGRRDLLKAVGKVVSCLGGALGREEVSEGTEGEAAAAAGKLKEDVTAVYRKLVEMSLKSS